MASWPAKRKITRQFARTVTAQKPFSRPLSGCSLKPGTSIGYGWNSVEPRENIAELVGVFGNDATRVVVFVKAFQPLMAYRPYHPRAVTRYITQVKNKC